MDQQQKKDILKAIIIMTRQVLYLSVIFVLCIFILIVSLIYRPVPAEIKPGTTTAAISTASAGPDIIAVKPAAATSDSWKAPDFHKVPVGKDGDMIRYGKELIVSTARYLGPQGSVAHLTNGMNCQNCHLEAGTKLFGNNFAGFVSNYPRLSGRSGKVEPASERIIECFERSLNGKVPDTNQREVRAILAYMKWIGKDGKNGQKLFGAVTEKLPFPEKAADPLKGQAIFISKCQSCHGKNGQGILAADKKSYTYPPLWGADSYNDGAGMYRIVNFAGFVKNNMPFGATYQNPQLTDGEAWNVAAFVNSQPRPHKDQKRDYPDLNKKPIDLPFGPYGDHFSAKQHKFGPFGPIQQLQKKNAIKKS
ncbi:MAG: hypothetical protein NVSMB24_26780 [Mucilaginibacter sp.]